MDQLNLIAHFVDSSPSSCYAFNLAKLFLPMNIGLQIHPIHIWGDWQPYTHNILFPFAPLGGDITEFEREIEMGAKASIQDWLSLDGSETYVREPIIYHGSCHVDLPKVFSHTPFDMVVVGAYGAAGTVPHSIGSATLRVVQSASIPILVAKPLPSKPSLKRLLLALDLTQKSHLLLAEAVELAIMLDASLHILYVFPDPVAHQRNDLLMTLLEFDPEESIQFLKGKINSYFDNVVRRLKVGYRHLDFAQDAIHNARILCGDPADTIIQYAIDIHADLIILGTKDPTNKETKGPLGRVAMDILNNAPCHLYYSGAFRNAE